MRIFGRVVIVAAFLLAQGSGLAHQIWHAGSLGAHASAEAGVDGRAPKKNALCDFHTALASVLGTINSGTAFVHPTAPAAIVFVAADAAATRFLTLAPQSRGPPSAL